VLLAAFVVIELRSEHPLMRLDIFRTRSLAIANSTMLVVTGGMFAVFFFATLYVQQILHLSPVEAGLGFLPLTAAIIAASGLAQPLIGRIGIRNVALAGMSIAAVGLLLLARSRADGSYVADVLPGILVIGLGLGFTFVPLTLIGTTNVDARDAGLASGLFNTSQQIGGALGLAILSTFAANRTTSDLATLGRAPSATESASALVSGYHVGFVAGAGLLLLGVVVTAALLRRSDVATLDQAQDTDEPAVQPRPLEPAFEIDD
jgi:predicted MFS family arabinose efflux permease